MTRDQARQPLARRAGQVTGFIAGIILLAGCSAIGPGGAEKKSTLSHEQAVKSHVTSHWTPDLYSGDPAGIVVMARLQLKQDGTVDGAPDLTVENDGGQTDAIVQAYVDSVRLAITRSEPFPLAADEHALWRLMELRFNLKEDSRK
ncbi:MAG: hypothetical protein P1U65_06285 [Minwuia sp.]|nr:hypothetical protein [Minwuia sp.]